MRTTTWRVFKPVAICGSAHVRACGSARRAKLVFTPTTTRWSTRSPPTIAFAANRPAVWSDADPTLFEEFRDDQPAFIAEFSIDLVADILPSWSLRVGYEVLFIDSIVLAGENFNTGSPYNQGPVDNGFGPLRTPFVEDESDVVYHGGHAGIEFIW